MHGSLVRVNAVETNRPDRVVVDRVPPGRLGEAGLVVPIEEVIPRAGELVIAVQYRKVKFKWFSSREVDKAVLERSVNRWKVFLLRARQMENGATDCVEVDLQETLVMEDVVTEDSERTQIDVVNGVIAVP